MAKALPLQIHPDKDLAAQLHQKDPCRTAASEGPLPSIATQTTKPKLGVALTTFELFVGFKPLDNIQTLLQAATAAPVRPQQPNAIQ